MKRTKPFLGLFGRKAPRNAPDLTLAPPLDDLISQEVQRSTRKVASPLPRFQVNAADQISRRGSDTLERLRVNLRNAFTPSQPVQNPSMFAGRLEVLTRMIQSIEDQRLHLVIYGDRGIGKTSLLHMLSDAGRDARYIVVYMSCGAASSFDETFRAASHDIPLLFHSGYAPTTSEAEHGSTLADLLPASPVTPRQFGELCARITGTRALIVLDEFDRCEAPQFRRDLAELIKILSDRSLRVQLVIAGVAADLADLVEHIPSIRRNILAIKVPLMSEEDIHDLIANGERISGVSFDGPARELVTQVAYGSPYIASLLCHHAGLIALTAKRTAVGPADVSAAVTQAIDELWLRIPKTTQIQIQRAADSAGEALTILAKTSLTASGPFEPSQIVEIAGSVEKASRVKLVADQLVKSGTLLQSHDDAYGLRLSFIDEGVASYLWFRAAQHDFDLGAKALREKPQMTKTPGVA
ncbi:MAG: uncharacterized protein JWO33_2022 [Caulobacteraceae bacterium]|nr:uncharacterized protein [Caulobacteraceae bacterium]